MEDHDNLVSDAERDRAVASLREHLVAGRLTLEQFSERVELAFTARVGRDLAHAHRALPQPSDVPLHSPRRKPTRLTAALFSHVVRRGRLRLRRWTIAAGAVCDVDLDLREAELDNTTSSVIVLMAFGNADVYVPEGVEVTVGGLSAFGHRRDWGRDVARADAPIIRVRAFSLFGTVDIWRVAPDMHGGYEDIFKQLQEPPRQLKAHRH